MQRVQGEEQRHPRAGPAAPGGAIQKREEQQHGQRMQQHVGEMVPSAAQAEHLAIEHVRKARERKPVGSLAGSECPSDVRRSDTGAHVLVGGDVLGVVKIDEVKVADLRVHGERRQEQEHR